MTMSETPLVQSPWVWCSENGTWITGAWEWFCHDKLAGIFPGVEAAAHKEKRIRLVAYESPKAGRTKVRLEYSQVQNKPEWYIGRKSGMFHDRPAFSLRRWCSSKGETKTLYVELEVK